VFLHNCRIQLTAKDAAMAGAVSIGGLPWPAKTTFGASNGGIPVGAFENITFTAGFTQLGVTVDASSGRLSLIQSKTSASGAAAAIDATALSATTAIIFSGFYQAA
jgi:UDP-N-acetylglucosamine enolpyruvyl transferase